ncbi:MAG TPA: rod shape-determining protein MreC [Dehalococcoidia bacterium]|nr:rod shape-determining protein MreC [Dehalococcoidia bacterium]
MVDARNAARLTILAALGALLLALSLLPVAGNIEERTAALVQPLTTAVRDVTRPLADVVLNAGQVRELSEENATLRRQLNLLESEVASLRELAAANARAASLLDAVGDDAGRFLPAAAVLRDPSPTRHEIVIDRGAAEGVAIGQPVLGAGATLIGVIADVDDHRSRVRLLSDQDSAVTAVVQESRLTGALAGGKRGLLLEFIPVDAPIATGDLVLTSDLGGLLPGGLLIGRVASIDARGQELFATVHVEPLADYARIEQVLVLTQPLASAATTDAAAGVSQ